MRPAPDGVVAWREWPRGALLLLRLLRLLHNCHVCLVQVVGDSEDREDGRHKAGEGRGEHEPLGEERGYPLPDAEYTDQELPDGPSQTRAAGLFLERTPVRRSVIHLIAFLVEDPTDRESGRAHRPPDAARAHPRVAAVPTSLVSSAPPQ